MWLNLEGKSEKKNPCFLASLSKHNLHLGVPLSLVLLLYEEPDWSGFVRHYGLRFIPGTPKIFAELCWYMLHIIWPFLRFRWAHLNCVETYMHTCDTGNGVSFVGSLLSCEKLWSVDCSISVWWSMVWCGVVWCVLSVLSHKAQSLAPGFSSIVGHTPAQCGIPEHCETHFLAKVALQHCGTCQPAPVRTNTFSDTITA